MSLEPSLINPANLPAYLHSRGLVTDPHSVAVRELGGGVSNIVLRVEWLGDPGRRWVAKQSLGKLRVEDDWRSERLAKYNRLRRIEERLSPRAVYRGAEVFAEWLPL